MYRKKVIHEIQILGNNDTLSVQNIAKQQIDVWQNDGYEVNIHYSINNGICSVLLEKYSIEFY